MAGNRSVPDDETIPSDEESADTARNSSLLGRRGYLAATGAALVGLATAAPGGAAGSTDGYETITVPEGGREVIEVGDGEILENLLVDVTSAGSGVTIAAYGTGWTIRNVAVRGRVDMGDECIIGAADTGGDTSRIENVWLGDGAVPEEKGGTGLWVNPEHSGHLEIERVNVQEMGDNGLYCSAPGGAGGGTVAIRDCYAANCWVSHYRLAEGEVENCVAHLDDAHMDGRGVWAWGPGPVTVRECDLDMNGRHYAVQAGANGDGTAVEVVDTQYDTEYHDGIESRYGSTVDFDDDSGTDPENYLPEGCPASIEDALE